MKDIKDRAREYLIKHSEYSEVFDQTFVAVDTLTAMVDFAEQENAELQVQIKKLKAYNEKLLDGDIEKHNKIVELQEKISILLSCKNCSENKGGYICQKEYEDKCLAQKIQYIKELKEENRQLKNEVEDLSSYCNQIGKVKTEVLKAFEHIVAK